MSAEPPVGFPPQRTQHDRERTGRNDMTSTDGRGDDGRADHALDAVTETNSGGLIALCRCGWISNVHPTSMALRRAE